MRPLTSKLYLCVFGSEIAGLALAFCLSSVVAIAYGQPNPSSNAVTQSAAGRPAPLASAPVGRASGNVPADNTIKTLPTLAPSAVSSPRLTPPPYLTGLETTNPFDAQGKVWPDKRPPPVPPPPPPPPPTVTDKDLQLYGVVIVGPTKRATVKVGSRFAQLDTQGRGFVSISEGQALGDWVLAEIHPTHLVLGAPGGKQMVMFNKKTDRVATASPQPIQTSLPAVNESSPNPQPSSAPALATSSDGSPARPSAGASPPATAATAITAAVPNAADNALKNAQPGSLAAAISAAQAAAQAAPPSSQNTPPPANFNPFLQLFPKQ